MKAPPPHVNKQRQAVAIVLLGLISVCRSSLSGMPVDDADRPRDAGDSAPFFEVWDEDNVYGVLEVAMDGTILLISLQGDPHPDKRRGGNIYLKRSEDGGATWSDHELIAKPIPLDWRGLGIGPYDGSGWGKEKHHGVAHLGTSVVDETTGEIMFFMTALHPASYMYKSQDHGRTWSLEKIEFRKDSRGFLSVPNAACDPGVTLRHGPRKGRLLVPSRVMVNYSKHEEAKGYTCAIYSDDHGKTWASSEPFPLDGTGESGLVELRDGTIYINSRTHTRAGNRWVAYSDDSGETWRDLRQDDELFDGPPDVYGCKAGLLRLDRDDFDILLFSSPTSHLPGRKNIRVWVSFDGGTTWPHSRLIRRGPGNYTWMAQGREGTPSEGFLYLLSGKDWMARFNLAWLLQSEPPEQLASPRGRYRFSDADVFESAMDAELFESASPRFKNSPRGYRLKSGSDKGYVRTRRTILPSGKMRLSCNASSGRLMIHLVDESDTRVRDSHWLTNDHDIDELVPWQDGPIDPWVGKEVYIHCVLEGDAEVFDVRFDDMVAAGGSTNRAPPLDRLVLPPRNDYVVGQTPPFVESVKNAERFHVDDERLGRIKAGYRLNDVEADGHVVSHAFSLPSKELGITCDVSSGSIRVSLFAADGKLIKTSEPVVGGLKIRELVAWPQGFRLDPYVSTSVVARIELQGSARVYALRFENLFWE